jgi:carbonic anhydrase
MSISRRSFLSNSGIVTGAALAGLPLTSLVATAKPAAPPHPAASSIIARLMAGNARYMAGKTIHGDHTARRDELTGSQRPFAMILSCADSRVPPELIFDEALGDLFVVRIAGNYAETGGIGSFEYSFHYFNSPLLMVLGHSNCGAVHATVDAMKNSSGPAPGDINAIVNAIMPAAKAVNGKPGDIYANAIAQNARMNASKLASQKPILSAGVAANKLQVVSAVYDLKTGKVNLI